MEKELALFNQSKEEIINLIKGIDKDKLTKKPSEDEWSLTQVVAHLIDSETGISKYIHKKSQELDELKNTGIKNSFMSYQLNKNLKSDKKFKAPKVVSSPPNTESFEELTQRWEETRKRFLSVIEKLPKSAHKKQLFKHPRVGYLNIKQTLSFMAHHINHHIKQIESIKQSL